jgi:uncharacterized DUF497 family protein
MKITFDPVKNARNLAERGLSFERAEAFQFSSAIVRQDIRKPYPEVRLVALGFLEARLHVLCFTPVAEGIRVISFRKANAKERKDYENNAPHD